MITNIAHVCLTWCITPSLASVAGRGNVTCQQTGIPLKSTSDFLTLQCKYSAGIFVYCAYFSSLVSTSFTCSLTLEQSCFMKNTSSRAMYKQESHKIFTPWLTVVMTTAARPYWSSQPMFAAATCNLFLPHCCHSWVRLWYYHTSTDDPFWVFYAAGIANARYIFQMFVCAVY